MEIERKFLVARPPDGLERHRSEPIGQGYLAIGNEGEEVRLRKLGERTFLTVKRGRGEVRTEQEAALEPDQFDVLWPLTEGRRVFKTRHWIPLGDLEIELDVYGGELEGLVTAEIEFESEAHADAFEPPSWLGEDVTDDDRYKNESLATGGLPR
ncbi:MAG TPA: CYTH domain-containing protein [Solirubrobacterales bacterium]|nr:CYTH domain-containing protein [Solirubrobacterales bacterium]